MKVSKVKASKVKASRVKESRVEANRVKESKVEVNKVKVSKEVPLFWIPATIPCSFHSPVIGRVPIAMLSNAII